MATEGPMNAEGVDEADVAVSEGGVDSVRGGSQGGTQGYQHLYT